MPLLVKKFFDDVLALPFGNHEVIGNSYYAAPQSGSVLRLRIDFAPTIRYGEYDGLRLRVIHPDQGVVDTAILPFAEHGTFTRRDATRDLGAGRDGYAVFRDWNSARTGEPPWTGAEGAGLREAIQQYVRIWFPGTWAATAPARPPAHTARNMPTTPVRTSSARSR